jgi:hypothetical protein
MKQVWMKWLDGLVNALFGGIATGFAAIVADPISFDPHTNLGNLVTVCLVSAVLCGFNYIKQSPLPIASAVEEKKTGE